MIDFIDVGDQKEEQEPDLPRLSDPGRILFRYNPAPDDGDDVVEILDYDSDSAPFWLNEVGFMDYTVEDMIDLELAGVYVLEGVTGHGHTDYWGEYDEEWEFERCRRASRAEEETESLEACMAMAMTKNYAVVCQGHVSLFEQYESALSFVQDFGGVIFNLWGLRHDQANLFTGERSCLNSI